MVRIDHELPAACTVRFRAELARLSEPRAESGVAEEGLRSRERRIAELQAILATADVVEPDA